VRVRATFFYFQPLFVCVRYLTLFSAFVHVCVCVALLYFRHVCVFCFTLFPASVCVSCLAIFSNSICVNVSCLALYLTFIYVGVVPYPISNLNLCGCRALPCFWPLFLWVPCPTLFPTFVCVCPALPCFQPLCVCHAPALFPTSMCVCPTLPYFQLLFVCMCFVLPCFRPLCVYHACLVFGLCVCVSYLVSNLLKTCCVMTCFQNYCLWILLL
jgi:hypothetical protein